MKRDDPYSAYNFLVVLNGPGGPGQFDGTDVTAAASFTEVTGLEVEVSPIEYRNGNEDMRVRKMSGLKKCTNITLKRGITGHVEFWNWIQSTMTGDVDAMRVNGSIVLLDENKRPEAGVMRWNWTRGWICKYTGPTLNAANNEIAMETVEICHEGLEIEVQEGS